jgi:hypothetical protein
MTRILKRTLLRLQRADAGVAACTEAIRARLNCEVTGPFLGDWNRCA